MKNFSILMFALAFCFFTHEAHAQSKTTAKPAESIKGGGQGEKAKKSTLYNGKPVSFWIGKLNDFALTANEEARKALVTLDPNAVVPALIEALEGEDRKNNFRRHIAEVLGDIGPEAKQAIPALKKVLRDKTARSAAIDAFPKIIPEGQILVLTRSVYWADDDIHALPTAKKLEDLCKGKMAVPFLVEGFYHSESYMVLPPDDYSERRNRLFRETSRLILGIGAEGIPILIEHLSKERNKNCKDDIWKVLSRFGEPAVVPLLELLTTEKNQETQVAGAKALGNIGPAAKVAAPVLQKMLKSDNDDTGIAAAVALWKITRRADLVVPELIERMNKRPGEIAEICADIGPASKAAVPSLIEIVEQEKDSQGAALYALGKIGTDADAAIPTLLKAFAKAQDSSKKVFFAQVLGKLGSNGHKEAIPRLVEIMKEDSQAGREALKVLAGLGKPAVPALIEAVKSDSAKLRGKAISAFAEIGPDAKEALPVLKKAATDKERLLRLAAAWSIWKIEGDKTLPVDTLTELMKDKDAWVRLAAARSIWKIEGDKTMLLAEACELMKNKDKEIRIQGYVTLKDIGPPVSVVPTLTLALRARDEGERERAAELLGEIGPAAKGAVPSLLSEFRRFSIGRHVYAFALGKIGDKSAIPSLVAALNDDDEVIRFACAEALGNFGVAANSCIPDLEQSAGDKSIFVRRAARKALEKLKAAEK